MATKQEAQKEIMRLISAFRDVINSHHSQYNYRLKQFFMLLKNSANFKEVVSRYLAMQINEPIKEVLKNRVYEYAIPEDENEEIAGILQLLEEIYKGEIDITTLMYALVRMSNLEVSLSIFNGDYLGPAIRKLFTVFDEFSQELESDEAKEASPAFQNLYYSQVIQNHIENSQNAIIQTGDGSINDSNAYEEVKRSVKEQNLEQETKEKILSVIDELQSIHEPEQKKSRLMLIMQNFAPYIPLLQPIIEKIFKE